MVKRRATDDDVLMRGGFVPWSHVAWWLFETLTYERVICELGADADVVLPLGLRAVPITWIAPAWIVHALDVQRQTQPVPHRTVRPSTRSEYLTDLLSRGIDPNTVRLLRGDPDFVTAFDFPDGGTDA